MIAGAPANYQTHLHAWSVAVGVAALKDKTSNLSPANLRMINQAVLATCDAADGVKDGLLADPRRCHFDPSTLMCATNTSENCLTPAQVEAVKKIYAPVKTQSGTLIFPSFEPGSELGWGPMTGGPEPSRVAAGTFAYLVYKNPKWDWRTFDAERDTALADSTDIINATKPDLSAFQSRGGKLLMYHGWADPAIPPGNTVNFYNGVLAKMGKNQGDWVRLFMVPGMEHCGGGPGTDQFNKMAVLERWREEGAAPSQIVAAHVTNGQVSMTRPLCPYPQVAVYKGTGSTNDAGNFSCKTQ
ncbi:MAG: tannase/feruloyl esterase family alpha/beta hydrolase [Acidobacteriia bacterium]|nr:tannase/feruloyl esterase family alpha/beta hydrolase [Terriglobia bacterium]